MDRRQPDFDEQDSGVPVTSPDRNPDALGPQHSSEPGAGGGSAQGGRDPAAAMRYDKVSDLGQEGDEPAPSVEGGPAVPGRESGLDESNPAQGL